MFDQSGREVKVGAQVHIHLNGMYAAIVADIREVPIMMPNRKMAPPQVQLQIMLAHVPGGGNCGFYVVREPENEQAAKAILVQ